MTDIRLVVCDDHAVVRAGLLALLSSADGIEVVGEAGSGEEAVAMAAKLRPDVVLMDLQLGAGIDGVEATRRIAAASKAPVSKTPVSKAPTPEAPTPKAPATEPPAESVPLTEPAGHTTGGPYVLVLTTYDTDADITRAIEAGATGYLLKAERPDELFAAIRAAAQGRTALSPPVAGRVMAHMRAPGPQLTVRERDILGQLARGLGNRDIARALFISEATVKTHLGRIYDKLGVDTRAGAVAAATERRLLG